jgi:hypothetical protein
MKIKSQSDFIIKIPKKLYSKDLQKMFDFLRYKKATSLSKATQKNIDILVSDVRKARNEKKQALQYL